MFKSILRLCWILCSLLLMTGTSSAAPGDLDLAFGTNGKVLTDSGANGWDILTATAIQSDDKIVAVGQMPDPITQVDSFTVLRYNADGSLDNTFGTNGIVNNDYTVANAVVVQPDGKIVVAGMGGAFGNTFTLVRYNTNGTLDITFGTNGRILTSIVGGSLHDVVLQPDGKIIVVGRSYNAEFVLLRFTPNGLPDATFGIDGEVFTLIQGGGSCYSVGIQADGKIVVAGDSNGLAYPSFALARYQPNGLLDNSFGTNGLVTTDFAAVSSDRAYDLVIQPDGKIIAAGITDDLYGKKDFALARYNSNGTLDASFGNGGLVTTDFETSSPDIANALALQADGKIIAAGSTFLVTGRFAIARYNTDGALDAGFGTGGLTSTYFGGSTATASSIALQSDGQIVAAGYAGYPNMTDFDFALARYQVQATPAPDIKANGSDTPITIAQGDVLDVTAALDPATLTGQAADWWVHATTPFGEYWYATNGNWSPSPTPVQTYGGSLINLAPRSVLNMSTLPAGAYTFHFSVDSNMDGVMDETWLDSVQVTVQ